jgi:hypothetical protein
MEGKTMSLLSETPDPVNKVTVHHTFSNQFHVVHADGAWQSVSVDTFIHLMFFTVRLPTPTETEYIVSEDKKTLVNEIVESRKLREGFDREFQVDVVLTKDTAKSVCEGLLKFLEKNP